MGKILILYFSGTGMTKYMAERLYGHFTAANAEAALMAMDQVTPEEVGRMEADVLVISYPVHAFRAPELVVNFVRRLPPSKGKRTVIAYTAAADSPLNYAASRLLMKTLRKKGYLIVGNKLVQMPSNFGWRTPDEEIPRLLEQANASAGEIARHILSGEVIFDSYSRWAVFLSALGKAEWLGAHLAGRFYYADESCVSCGLCAQRCPKQNIKQGLNTVTFGWSCLLCMRCVYLCPVKAIQIRRPFRFMKINPWYSFDDREE